MKTQSSADADSPAIPSILQALAEVVEAREAIPLLERALVLGRATQGAHHPTNAAIEAALASKLLAVGRTDDALKAAADALAIDQATIGIAHPLAARAMVALAQDVRPLRAPAKACATTASRLPALVGHASACPPSLFFVRSELNRGVQSWPTIVTRV